MVVTLVRIARDWGSIFHWGTEFFWIANCHLFVPLLHQVPNVVSELEMHEDMNVIAISVLSDLVIITLTQIMRD